MQPSVTTSRLSVCFNLFLGLATTTAGSPGLVIDHAYFRRLVPMCGPPRRHVTYWRQEPTDYDPGTVHMFLRNDTDQPIGIARVYVNDVLLPPDFLFPELRGLGDLLPEPADREWEEAWLPSDRFIWYQVLPNPVPPGKVADVMAKFAYLPKHVIKIAVATATGQELSRVVQPKRNPFRMTFVGFSDEYDEVYVYLKNDSDRTLSIARVSLDTRDVTARSTILSRSLEPYATTCIIIKPESRLRQGEYIAVKVEPRESDLLTAEAVVRVWSYFPISSWDGDTRASRHFDTVDWRLRSPAGQTPSAALQDGAPGKAIYRPLGDPNSRDRKSGILGTHAWNVITGGMGHRSGPYPCMTNVDDWMKPRAYFAYGETSDVLAANPYELQMYALPIENNGYYVQMAKMAAEPRMVYALPEAYTSPTRHWGAARYPTPEEMRLIVYYEISRGAKGILYYKRGGDHGYGSCAELDEAIGHINLELQLLKSWLKNGDPVWMPDPRWLRFRDMCPRGSLGALRPVSLARSDCGDVDLSTILVSNRALVLIMINRKCQSHVRDRVPRFTSKALPPFDVTVSVPQWLTIKVAYEIGPRMRKTEFRRRRTELCLSLDGLRLAKAIVLTTQASDLEDELRRLSLLRASAAE